MSSSLWFNLGHKILLKVLQLQMDVWIEAGLLAQIHQRYVLYGEFKFKLVLVFELTLTTEPEWTINMQEDLNMLVLHQDWAQS
jgi:hypothetical protein